MAQQIYTLERFNWRRDDKDLHRGVGTTRLQSFANFQEADAERRRLEVAARANVNPFRCGGTSLHCQTHFDAARLHDWLLDASLEPPQLQKDGARDWAEWWKRTNADMSELQRAKVWEALDKVRFYTVVEREARPTAFVIVQLHWEYNDSGYDADMEGGIPVRAFRNRENAEFECALLNESEHRDRQGHWAGAYDDRERRRALQEPLTNSAVMNEHDQITQVPFYEVIEIELTEDGA